MKSGMRKLKEEERITKFDDDVFYAAMEVAGFFGKLGFTAKQVAACLLNKGSQGKTEPSQKLIDKVEQSIEKQRKIFIKLDYTEELLKHYGSMENMPNYTVTGEDYQILPIMTSVYADGEGGRKEVHKLYVTPPLLYDVARRLNLDVNDIATIYSIY